MAIFPCLPALPQPGPVENPFAHHELTDVVLEALELRRLLIQIVVLDAVVVFDDG